MPISPRRSFSAQQRYALLSNRSESASFLSQEEEETEAETKVESLFSTSYEDDDDYDSNESRDWYGAVRKTLYQNTVRLLQGFDDWDDVSTDAEDYSRFDEDSRTNTTQITDAVSSIGAESARQQQSHRYHRQGFADCRAAPDPEREISYLSFRRRRVTPLKADVDEDQYQESNPIPLCRNHQQVISPVRKRSRSPFDRSASRSPSRSPQRSGIIPPTSSRAGGGRPRQHLQFNHNGSNGYIERAVISGDSESRSDDSLEYPNSPLLATPVDYPSHYRRKGFKRPAYIDTRIRRTKLGDISWDMASSPGKRSLGVSLGSHVAEMSRRKRERSAYKLDPLADLTTPHSAMAPHSTIALADTTTPHSTFASKSFQTPRERDHSKVHFHNQLQDDNGDSYPRVSQHENSSPEENEIVFDAADIDSSRPEDSLWEDGSAWKVGNDDVEPSLEDQYENLRTGTPERGNPLRNLLRRASCTAGSSALVLDKIESHIASSGGNATEARNTTERLSQLTGDDKPASEIEIPKQNIGVLQHFKNARCTRYPQFDESRLRAIVDSESSGRAEKSKKECAVLDSDRHKPRHEKEKTKSRQRSKSLKGQLVALGQRATCTSIPTVDSMPAETPRAPVDSSRRSFDADSSDGSSGVKRLRPQLKENEASSKPEQNPHTSTLGAEPRRAFDSNSSMYSPKFLSPMYGPNTGKVEWLVIKKEDHGAAEPKKDNDRPDDVSDSSLQDTGKCSPPTKSPTQVSPRDSQHDAPKKYHTLFGNEVAEFRKRQEECSLPSEETKVSIPNLKVECNPEEETEEVGTSSSGPIKRVVQNMASRFSPRKCTTSVHVTDTSQMGQHHITVLEGHQHCDEAEGRALTRIVPSLVDMREDDLSFNETTLNTSPPVLPVSNKPLVSVLRKGSKRRPLRIAGSKDDQLHFANRSRSRRVMFAEKVEEAFIDGTFRSETSMDEPELWPAEEFVKVFATCGRGSEDDGDADSILPVADLSEKAEVYHTPEDFQEFFSRNGESQNQIPSPVSVSKPLLAGGKLAQRKEPTSLREEADTLTTIPECLSSQDTASFSKSNVSDRFRMFRRKKEQKHVRQSDTSSSGKRRSQYKNLEDQVAGSQEKPNNPVENGLVRAKFTMSAKRRSRKSRYSSLKEDCICADTMQSEQLKEHSGGTVQEKTKSEKQEMACPDVEQRSSVSKEANAKKKRNLRLKVFRKLSGKPAVEEDSKKSKENGIEAPETRVSAPVARRTSSKKQRGRTMAKPVAFGTLQSIPEEESTQGSLSDDAFHATGNGNCECRIDCPTPRDMDEGRLGYEIETDWGVQSFEIYE